MKIIQLKTSMGLLNFLEVARIDKSKDITYEKNLEYPHNDSYIKEIGDDSRVNHNEYNQNDLKNIKAFYCLKYYLPLIEVNKDYWIINEKYHGDTKSVYFQDLKKTKKIPGVDNINFMKWFCDIYPYLNDEWKIRNKDYMDMMDKRILENNENMLLHFQNNNISEFRKCIKLGGDINFKKDGVGLLNNAIKNKDDLFIKYLINKNIVIDDSLNEEEKTYITPFLKKNKKKLSI